MFVRPTFFQQAIILFCNSGTLVQNSEVLDIAHCQDGNVANNSVALSAQLKFKKKAIAYIINEN